MPLISRILTRLIAIAAALSVLAVPAAARQIPGLPKGNARIVERERFLGFDRPYRLLDMSTDGNRIAFQWAASSRGSVWLGVIDLEARSLRLLTPAFYGDAASFSERRAPRRAETDRRCL
jgi:hypothetical protein